MVSLYLNKLWSSFVILKRLFYGTETQCFLRSVATDGKDGNGLNFEKAGRIFFKF